MKRLPPRLLFVLAALPSAVFIWYWPVRFLEALPSTGAFGIARGISSILAQNGLAFLVILFFLGSRNSLVERSIGLGRMLRLHKALALMALAFIAGHVVLQFWRFHFVIGPESVIKFLLNVNNPGIVVGCLALLLLIIAALPAILGVMLGLPIRIWKPLHLIAYAAVPLGMVHAVIRVTMKGEFPQVQVVVFLAVMLALAVIMRIFRQVGTLVNK